MIERPSVPVAESDRSVAATETNLPNVAGDHGPNGKFQPGNQAARQLGIFARQQPAPLVAAVEELKASIVSDLGGESELTTLERAYIGRLGDVEITLRLLAMDIAERGLLTPVGGVRRVHEAFLSAIDRWDRLAQRLGTKRRAKRVDLARALSGLDQ